MDKLDNIIFSNCEFQKKFDDFKLVNLKYDGTFSRQSRKTSYNPENSKKYSMSTNINIVDKVITNEKLILLMDDDNQDDKAIDSPVSSSFTMEFEKEERKLKKMEMSKSKSKNRDKELNNDEKKNTYQTEEMLSDNEDLDLEGEFNLERDRDGDVYDHDAYTNKLSQVKSLNEFNSPKQTTKQNNFTNEQFH